VPCATQCCFNVVAGSDLCGRVLRTPMPEGVGHMQWQPQVMRPSISPEHWARRCPEAVGGHWGGRSAAGPGRTPGPGTQQGGVHAVLHVWQQYTSPGSTGSSSLTNGQHVQHQPRWWYVGWCCGPRQQCRDSRSSASCTGLSPDSLEAPGGAAVTAWRHQVGQL